MRNLSRNFLQWTALLNSGCPLLPSHITTYVYIITYFCLATIQHLVGLSLVTGRRWLISYYLARISWRFRRIFCESRSRKFFIPRMVFPFWKFFSFTNVLSGRWTVWLMLPVGDCMRLTMCICRLWQLFGSSRARAHKQLWFLQFRSFTFQN